MNRHLASLTAAGLVAAATLVVGAAPAPAAPTYQGRVVATGGVVQRTAPSTHVGTTGAGIRKGAVVTLDCQLNGTVVGGNQRWYKVHGRDAWIAARYVQNIGRAPVACTGGQWAYETRTGTNIRRGPSTLDAKIGSLPRGTEVLSRWVTTRGQSVGGNRTWVAVETTNGNRGWISVTALRRTA